MSALDRTLRAHIACCRQSLLAAVIAAGLAGSASSQAAPDAPWAGWAQCRLTTQGAGYTNQQTQTWTTTGGTPTARGALRMYPATWSASGSGSLQRTQGAQSLDAQWTMNAQSIGAPISVVVRASDRRRLIGSGHAQLRQRGGIAGSQTQTVSGKQTTTAISAEAFEYAFPVVVGAATTRENPRVTGSKTIDDRGSVGFMQPGGARTTGTCSWEFSQDGTAPAPPPVTP